VSHDKAMAIMREGAGTQFDPELFSLFEALMRSATGDGDHPHQPRDARRRPLLVRWKWTPVPRDDLTGLTMRRPFH
jgi:hypothetical protein